MKIIKIVGLSVLMIIFTACGQPQGSANNNNSGSGSEKPKPKESKVTFYLVSSDPVPGMPSFGCAEYLVKETKTVSGEPTIGKALKALFEANPTDYGSALITASAIKDGFFILDSVDPDPPVGTTTTQVSLSKREGVGLTGACDTPRFKQQITETIRAQAGSSPFVIKYNGTARNWECLGNESGLCT